jgi:hypothetical protein
MIKSILTKVAKVSYKFHKLIIILIQIYQKTIISKREINRCLKNYLNYDLYHQKKEDLALVVFK